MSRLKDGGPAFPVAYDHQVLQPKTVETAKRLMSGMSLRDHFAGLAMQGFISGHIAHHGHESHWLHEEIADCAYEVADSMLAQLEKGGAA